MIFNIKGFIKFLVNNTLTNLKPKLSKFSYKLRTNYYIIKVLPNRVNGKGQTQNLHMQESQH